MAFAMIVSAEPAVSRLIALVPLALKDAMDPFASVAAAAAIAAECDAAVDALLLGNSSGEQDAAAAFAAGAARVWVATHPRLAPWGDSDQLVAAFAEALSAPELRLAGASLLLLPAGAISEEIAARLAMRLQGVPLGRCATIALTADRIAVTRPAYGGRAQTTLIASGGPCFATMQFTAASLTRHGGQEVIRLQLNGALPTTEHITHKDIGERLAPVEGAKVVVCGGRGIGNADGFALLQDLAGTLGGALGGSLQAVDAGWLPVARQVGQSGKYVTAELYIGVGVSGTPQHMAGVGSNTRIVAINSDPGADIFRFAEIGIVADWKEVILPLIEKLQPGAPA
jgi:electron transfer flavoprotein alpha subunit